jgi:Fe-S cluster biogenesis protein NfuA
MTARQAERATTPDAAARRVEALLDALAGAGGPAVAETGEELVRALMDFYGAGLARAVALLSGRSGNPLGALLDDETTAGLLVLHGLHPDDLHARVERALRAADTEAGTVEVAGFDAATGTLRLQQQSAGGGGCGCGGSGGAARERIEAALACFAPEVTALELEELPAVAEPVLLQIGVRPPDPGRRSGVR